MHSRRKRQSSTSGKCRLAWHRMPRTAPHFPRNRPKPIPGTTTPRRSRVAHRPAWALTPRSSPPSPTRRTDRRRPIRAPVQVCCRAMPCSTPARSSQATANGPCRRSGSADATRRSREADAQHWRQVPELWHAFARHRQDTHVSSRARALQARKERQNCSHQITTDLIAPKSVPTGTA